MQLLVISGNVGRDAVLRSTQGGDDVLGFTLAVNNGKDANGNDRPATWYDCSVWGKRASKLESYITKGTKLILRGRPSARSHEGKAYLQISVDDLEFVGGGSRDQGQQGNGYGHSDPGYQAPSGGGYGAGGVPDDSEIPFAPQVL